MINKNKNRSPQMNYGEIKDLELKPIKFDILGNYAMKDIEEAIKIYSKNTESKCVLINDEIIYI